MKKLLALLCLFTLLTAFTCENEAIDEGIDLVQESDAEIIGEWNLFEFEVDATTSITFQGQEFTTDFEIFSTDADYQVVFGESTFTTNGSYSYNTIAVSNGNELPMQEATISNVTGSGTYSTNGNEITTDGQFFEFSFEGVDTSIFEGEQTADFSISADGQILTVTQNETQIQTDPVTGSETTSIIVSSSTWTRSAVTIGCNAETATEQAEAAYNADPTNEALCEAYRTALENQIAECGDDGSLQAILNDIGDCATATSSGELRVRAGTLVIEFTEQTVSLDGGIITVEGVSSQGNYMIYFQVEEGQTGTDVFQNFVLTLSGTEFFPSTQGFEDFTSNTTVSSGNVLQATFNGIVENAQGGDLGLTQGVVDVTY